MDTNIQSTKIIKGEIKTRKTFYFRAKYNTLIFLLINIVSLQLTTTIIADATIPD